MKYIVAIIFIIFFTPCFAQFNGISNPLAITGSNNNIKQEIPLSEPSIVGSTYLIDSWHKGEIVLKSGLVVDEYPIKIEIEQANVEIEFNKQVKYLNLKDVEQINLINEITGEKTPVKRASRFSFENVPLKGIVMVHEGKRYALVKQHYIEFLQSNYNVAMDVGSKDHRKVKREKLFLSVDGNLISTKSSGKKIAAQLGQDEEKALKVLKESKLKLSKESHLKAFIALMEQ